jgi:hypothetical protein
MRLTVYVKKALRLPFWCFGLFVSWALHYSL